MPQYRRSFHPGGTFFLTIVTENRARILTTPAARALLHTAIEQCRATRPFEIDAIVLLPDHWHILHPPACRPRLPHPHRLHQIRLHPPLPRRRPPRTTPLPSREHHRRRGIWQRHFWEHTIRDKSDLHNHIDYTHYNPVKHHHATCPHAWPWSSFPRHVADNHYAPDWQCRCHHPHLPPPNFDSLPIHHME